MGNDLVLLIECADGLEANLLKARLEAAGVVCVIQGELHSSLLGGTLMPTPIGMRVLVHETDLPQAQTVLATPEPAAPLEVCTVHHRPRTHGCARCSTPLCDACGPDELCESCAGVTPRSRWSWVPALAVPIVLLVLIALLMQYLGVVPD